MGIVRNCTVYSHRIPIPFPHKLCSCKIGDSVIHTHTHTQKPANKRIGYNTPLHCAWWPTNRTVYALLRSQTGRNMNKTSTRNSNHSVSPRTEWSLMLAIRMPYVHGCDHFHRMAFYTNVQMADMTPQFFFFCGLVCFI